MLIIMTMKTSITLLLCFFFISSSSFATEAKNKIALEALEKILPGQQYLSGDLGDKNHCYVNVKRTRNKETKELEYFEVEIFNFKRAYKTIFQFHLNEKKSNTRLYTGFKGKVKIRQIFNYLSYTGVARNEDQQLEVKRTKEQLSIKIINKRKHVLFWRTFQNECKFRLKK